MTPSQRIFVLGGLLLCGLGLPRISYGITGCSNSNLQGTYDVQITNQNLINVLQTLNTTSVGNTGATGNPGTTGTTVGNTGSTGTTGATGTTGSTVGGTTGSTMGGTTGSTTGTTGSTTGGSTGSTSNTGTAGTTTTGGTTSAANIGGFGLVNTSASLTGATPGLGRFLFDGGGNIVGLAGSPENQFNAIVGTYSVNSDCTASLRLNSGQTFDTVIVDAGNQALFVETDTAGQGAVGTLKRAVSFCSDVLRTFGFSFSGANRAATTTSTTGTGTTTGSTGSSGTTTGGTTGSTGATGTTGNTGATGTTGGTTGTVGSTGSTGTTGSTVTTATAFMPFSAVGTINLNGAGQFALTETVVSGGTVQHVSTTGTYTLATDCTLKLSVNPLTTGTNTGTTASLGFAPPRLFGGMILDQNGAVVSLEPDAATTLTSTFISQ